MLLVCSQLYTVNLTASDYRYFICSSQLLLVLVYYFDWVVLPGVCYISIKDIIVRQYIPNIYNIMYVIFIAQYLYLFVWYLTTNPVQCGCWEASLDILQMKLAFALAKLGSFIDCRETPTLWSSACFSNLYMFR